MILYSMRPVFMIFFVGFLKSMFSSLYVEIICFHVTDIIVRFFSTSLMLIVVVVVISFVFVFFAPISIPIHPILHLYLIVPLLFYKWFIFIVEPKRLHFSIIFHSKYLSLFNLSNASEIMHTCIDLFQFKTTKTPPEQIVAISVIVVCMPTIKMSNLEGQRRNKVCHFLESQSFFIFFFVIFTFSPDCEVLRVFLSAAFGV